ncbi:FtsX-like permease family protein [Alteromonas sediminis]|uniref:FtsX-like permease family protein n=1 Tax=Alteromonas sediminis TaxID=2259342 RepID=A0A3N5Y396_9ALTE|nr:FtsX-like permease family protein [Alteromonas sediminis]RPJ68477.1 FtsX-like permease family protein [Alteromonas sediminis]
MLRNNLALAWHFFTQERTQAHYRYLRWTQALLMVFIVTLSQTSHTIQAYLADNLANLLGADIVLSQQSALNDSQTSALDALTQKRAITKSVITTLTHNGQWQRAQLKAVGHHYPMQGELLTANALNDTGRVTLSGPENGEIWLEARLLAGLGLNVGDTLILAGTPLIVTKVLLHEPDRLMEGHNVDMRAMVSLSQLEMLNFSSELLTHRYLFEASNSQIKQVLAWQKTHLPAAQVFHKTGAHPLALFWKRTENFLGLTSIILFFMAAIAIEKLTHIHIQKEQYFTAVCMSLGASKYAGLQVSLCKWALNMLFLMPPVLAFSAGCHWLLVDWLSSTFTAISWHWNMGLGISSLLSITLIFLLFQAPVWIGLKHSSVTQLVNNTQGKVSYGVTLICAIAVMAVVAMSYSDNGLLTTMVLAALLISIVMIIAISWGALTVAEKATKRLSGLFPFVMFMMKQRLVNKSTQILGVGLCAFLLLFTLMLMKDLGDTLSAYQREQNGNLLVTQATAEQMQDVKQWAENHGAEVRQQKPFTYAKLIRVNGQHLSDYATQPSESMSTMAREIRLHWTDDVPANNRVVSGAWWQQPDADWQQISVEQEVMLDLGLDVGDTLTFYIGQHAVDFTISASHVYRAGGGSITFWVQMPVAVLDHISAPHYSMASIELADTQFGLLNELWQRHPTLRMVSLQEMTARFDDTLAMVTQVISGFSILIILLSVIVILATIHAVEGTEKKKNSIIMSFGFSKTTCLQLNLIEWLVTGAVAATGAIAGTYIAGLLIYQSQFSLPYQPDFLWLAGTLLLIMASVTAVGTMASRKSLNSSIRELMTEQ